MTRQIMCGDVPIGGGAPISIQSMTNTDTRDVRATTAQIARLEEAGCRIVRCAVPDGEAAEALSRIRKQIRLPLVADIHFDYRLALAAIRNGADKIRINPGNIGGREEIRAVLSAAKERGIPIRVGVNAGSLEKELLQKYGGVTAEALAESALKAIGQMEDMDFDNLVLSLKASDVRLNYEAHKLIAGRIDYPLHIGITESGPINTGRIRSAVGLGALLLSGIGDTLRVSLTGDPVEEVHCAKEILKAVGLAPSGITIISCPTCGRTQVDLMDIVTGLEAGIGPIELRREQMGLPPLIVAVMGCAVNGPGEAREADLGVACGKDKGVIFRKGIPGQTVSKEQIVQALLIALAES